MNAVQVDKKGPIAFLNPGDCGFAQMLIPFLTPGDSLYMRLGRAGEVGIKQINQRINRLSINNVDHASVFLLTVLLGVKSLGMTATSLELLSMQESGCCWPAYFLINGTAQKSQGLHMHACQINRMSRLSRCSWFGP